ncbi:MAG: cation:proton antiporter, partial [Methylobacteriaceae bacterium]|nr:cation:proton antiporter [Methylobacteriaceae bacterium]
IDLRGWIAGPVLWKIALGVGLGIAVGRSLGWLAFHLPRPTRLSRSGDGFVALGITCLAYGLAELAGGYGFISVFVAALALRSTERGHEFHRKMHDFAEELERLLMMLLLVGFGAGIVSGGLLAGLTKASVFYALLALLLVRPACGWLALLGHKAPPGERAVIAFFGIRGLGTIYYLAWGLHHARFGDADVLWSTASLTILISIVLHGLTVTPVLTWLDWRSGRDLEIAQLEMDLPAPPRPVSGGVPTPLGIGGEAYAQAAPPGPALATSRKLL